MKDIKLLCAVLVIGGMMGATINREIDIRQSLVVKSLVWNSRVQGGGLGVLFTEKKHIHFAMSALNDVSTNIAVDDTGSLLTMTDDKKKVRLAMGVNHDGLPFLSMMDSKEKVVWSIGLNRNDNVTTTGH